MSIGVVFLAICETMKAHGVRTVRVVERSDAQSLDAGQKGQSPSLKKSCSGLKVSLMVLTGLLCFGMARPANGTTVTIPLERYYI